MQRSSRWVTVPVFNVVRINKGRCWRLLVGGFPADCLDNGGVLTASVLLPLFCKSCSDCQLGLSCSNSACACHSCVIW